jgi:hypothetical protein
MKMQRFCEILIATAIPAALLACVASIIVHGSQWATAFNLGQ